MYNKIKNGISSPKMIANYGNEKGIKTFGYFCFLVFLVTLPYFMVLIKFDQVPVSTISDIQSAFASSEEIDFQIVDYKLQTTGTESKAIELSNYNISVVFETEATKNSTVSVNNQLIIAFLDDGVYLTTSVMSSELALIATYQDLELTGLDFSLASEATNTAFWETLVRLLNNVVKENRGVILGIGIPAFYLTQAISLLFYIMIIALITYLFNRQYGIKYRAVLKIVICAYTPAALLSLVSTFFGLVIVPYIGIFLSLYYSNVATHYYALQTYTIGPRGNE